MRHKPTPTDNRPSTDSRNRPADVYRHAGEHPAFGYPDGWPACASCGRPALEDPEEMDDDEIGDLRTCGARSCTGVR